VQLCVRHVTKQHKAGRVHIPGGAERVPNWAQYSATARCDKGDCTCKALPKRLPIGNNKALCHDTAEGKCMGKHIYKADVLKKGPSIRNDMAPQHNTTEDPTSLPDNTLPMTWPSLLLPPMPPVHKVLPPQSLPSLPLPLPLLSLPSPLLPTPPASRLLAIACSKLPKLSLTVACASGLQSPTAAHSELCPLDSYHTNIKHNVCDTLPVALGWDHVLPDLYLTVYRVV